MCCVFWLAFRCCVHPKDGENTIFNLFCSFQTLFSDFTPEMNKKNLKWTKKMFFSFNCHLPSNLQIPRSQFIGLDEVFVLLLFNLEVHWNAINKFEKRVREGKLSQCRQAGRPRQAGRGRPFVDIKFEKKIKQLFS